MNNILLERYKSLGQDFDPKETIMYRSFRLTGSKDVLKRLEARGVKITKIDYLPNGYTYESDFSLATTPEFLSGEIYIQEAASQVPALQLYEKKPDAKQILDMCAAPGSKTTQLAQLYPNATVYALDANEARLKTVNYNVERYKLNNVLTIKKEAEYASDLGLSFDAILLDAPCSGNYCVEENFFEKRNLHDITTKSLTQKKLFKAAYKILKKEGVLVYSTCSLEPEEDEAVVSWALEQFEDIELLEANIPIATNAATSFSGASYGEEVSKAKKFWPHITNTEGFFVAIFQRKK